MKKILVFVVSLILFSKPVLAEENHFYLDNPIDGIYTMMDKVTKVAANYVKPVRKVETNEYVYCVTPGIAIDQVGNYQKIDNNPWNTLNITKEKYEKIQIISYYGYMYGNHTDLKWYAITQYLIWQEVLPEGWSVYFTNTLRGAKTNEFDWMINELNTLVNSYYIDPNIPIKLEGNYKNTITISDSNSVIHNYNSTNSLASVNGDSLIILPNSSNFDFSLSYKTNNIKSNLYIYNNAQWVISRGTLPAKNINFHVSIPKGNLNITKEVRNQNELDFDYKANLSNAKYRIFNDNYNNEFITDENGIIKIENLDIDDYYIKEIEPPSGFDIDNNIYTVSIIPNDTINIKLSDNLIIGKINILKKYLNTETNTYDDEENIVFGVLDAENNLLKTKKTNQYGYTFFNLPIGLYTITQLSSKDGYDKIKNEEFEVSSNEIISLNYYNKPLALVLDDFVPSPTIDEPEDKTVIQKNDELEEKKIKNQPQDNSIILGKTNDNIVMNDEFLLNKPIDNEISNPKTKDSFEDNLLILVTSFIILVTYFIKNIGKKKEMRYK